MLVMELQVLIGCLVCLASYVHQDEAAEMATLPRLYDHLMTNYRRVRPRINGSEPVEVFVDIWVHNIQDLDGRTGRLTILCDFQHYWVDEFLVWSPVEFDNIETMLLPAKAVWLPDVAVFNSMKPSRGDGFTSKLAHPVLVNSTGYVTWSYTDMVESSCDVNMAFFPFDTQNCTIIYAASSSPPSAIQLYEYTDYILDDFLTEDGEFIIASNQVVSSTYSLQDESYSISEIYIHLELVRRPLYYIINILLPCTVMAMLGVLAFYLPVTSGERVSLQVTMLLSFGVFQLMLANSIPVTSLDMPILNTLIILMMIVCALSLFANIFVIHTHGKVPSQKMSSFTHWVIFRCLAKITLCSHSCKRTGQAQVQYHRTADDTRLVNVNAQKSQLVTDSHTDTGQNKMTPNREAKVLADIASTLQDILVELKSIKQNQTKEAVDVPHQWKAAAVILDRFFLGLFSVVFISMGLFSYIYGHV